MVARAVSPWTWARILRDHGPRSRDFVFAMLILRTWMDSNGFCYPTLKTWAAGSRMAVGTLREHVKTAIAAGWLGVELGQQRTQGWRQQIYRCAVPDNVPLTEKDEDLSLAIIASFGDIDDDAVLADEAPTSPTVAEPLRNGSEGPSKTLRSLEAVSNQVPKLSQNTLEAVSNGPRSCTKAESTESRIPLNALESRKEVFQAPKSEVLEHPVREGAARAAQHTVTVGILEKETKAGPDPAGIAKAKRLIAASPEFTDREVAKVAHVSLSDVKAARTANGSDVF